MSKRQLHRKKPQVREVGFIYMKISAVVLALIIGLIYTQTFFRSVKNNSILGASNVLARGGDDSGSGSESGGSGDNNTSGSTQEDNKDSSITNQAGQESANSQGSRDDRPSNTSALNQKNGTRPPRLTVFPTRIINELEASDEAGDTIVSVKQKIHSQFPLSIDTTTNELIVTTPAGVRRVAVLPEVAVLNMLRERKIDGIVGGDDTASDEAGQQTGTEEASITPIEVNQTSGIQVDEQNGQIVYHINGIKNKKFLGVVPVQVQTQLTVSADSGSLISENQSIFNRLLSLLSF